MNYQFKVRQARIDDVSAIFDLILALAEYERLSDRVTGTAADLREHLFGDRPCAESIVAESDGKVIAFALFFPNYSTFLTKPGIYLEDLFVLPDYRRRGIGRVMLTYLGKLARDRDAGRLEWSVLDWNESAIAFYRDMGAEVLPDWRTCRVTGEALAKLGKGIKA